MDNNENINQILKELYAIDGNFRQHEEKLVKIISQLLKARPDAKLDRDFVEQLRRQLLAKASLLKTETNNNFSFMKRFSYILSGTIAVAALVVAGVFYNNSKKPANLAQTPEGQLLASNIEISKTGERAFGKFSAADLAPAGQGGGGAYGKGGAEGSSGDLSQKIASSPVAPDGVGGGAGTMIAPPYQTYTYTYTGGDISLDQQQMEVFRRVKGMGSNVSAAGLLKQLNFGLVDVSKFSNTKVQSLNVVEDKEFGYNFYISLEEGTIYISENWLKWPGPERECRDQQCYESLRLKLSDIPADGELISLANQFLKDHNISRASYGDPVVMNTWRQEYENFQDKSQFYIPNIITVVYPLKIQGQEVYDQGGNKAGLNVSIDVRQKRVSGVGELVNLKFDSSLYPAVTDQQTIIQYAEKGGAGGYYYGPENGKTTKVELGQPTAAYVKIWKNDGGQTQELLVPALLFPVVNAPNNYFQKNVVVPLIKDFMEDNSGPVRIMPAEEPKQ